MSSTADDIRNLVDRFYDKIQELQDAVNDALDWVPFFLDWITDRIQDLWNDLMNKIKSVFEPVKFVLSNLGEPSTLTSTGDKWSTQVGAPVSARVGLADLGSLAVDDNWKGSAADQYKQKVPLQKTALQNVKTQFTDGISGALKDVSSAIQLFFGVMVSALTVFVGAIILAIAACITLVGIPAAIIGLIAAGGVFDAALYGTMENLKSACRSAKTTLEQKVSDNTGYPNGAWPVATL